LTIGATETRLRLERHPTGKRVSRHGQMPWPIVRMHEG
jgi:hypothetical protein